MYEIGMEMVAVIGPWFFIFIAGSWIFDFCARRIAKDGAHEILSWLNELSVFCAWSSAFWHVFGIL